MIVFGLCFISFVFFFFFQAEDGIRDGRVTGVQTCALPIFNAPFQDLLNEYCWGAVWGREELPRKTRSMLNIAMISILNRPHELRGHLKEIGRASCRERV